VLPESRKAFPLKGSKRTGTMYPNTPAGHRGIYDRNKTATKLKLLNHCLKFIQWAQVSPKYYQRCLLSKGRFLVFVFFLELSALVGVFLNSWFAKSSVIKKFHLRWFL
jgi:hypothetical protein